MTDYYNGNVGLPGYIYCPNCDKSFDESYYAKYHIPCPEDK